MYLSKQLDELWLLHQICLDYEHGIKRHNSGSWRPFIPSKFIYTYFTFNGIYSIDWDESFQTNTIKEWLLNTEATTPKETKKIEELVKFCYATLSNETPGIFNSSLEKHLLGIDDPQEQLKHIFPDRRNVTEDVAKRFQKHFLRLTTEQLSKSKRRETLEKLLYIIFLVRNNIFHGEKRMISMGEYNQQQRLNIYVSILLATNEVFFQAAKSKDWQPPEISGEFY